MFSVRLIVCVLMLAVVPVAGALAQTIDRITVEGQRRTAEGAAAQDEIDRLADRRVELLAEYKQVAKVVDGLKVYNELLRQQVDNQVAELAALSESIESVSLIERQIMPLMIRMIDALARFVEIDTPFLIAERTSRVASLREMMLRADVTAAEKFRRVIEAYQIENEYGRTIEAYKDKLTLGDASFDADFLRIGRVALVYKTVGNEEVGYWDTVAASWKPLPGVPYRRYVKEGLKVAKQEVAPELISIPINPMQQVK